MKYFNHDLANFINLKSLVGFLYHQNNKKTNILSEENYIRNYIKTHMQSNYEYEDMDYAQLTQLLDQKEAEWKNIELKRDEEFDDVLKQLHCDFPINNVLRTYDLQITQEDSDIIIKTSDSLNFFCEIKIVLHNAFSPNIFSDSCIMFYELEMHDNTAHLTIFFKDSNIEETLPLNIYFESCDVYAKRYPIVNTGYADPTYSFAFTFNKLQYLQFVKDYGFSLNPLEEKLYEVTPEIQGIRTFQDEDCPNFKKLASELGFDLSKIKPKDLLFKLSERTYLPLAEKIEAMIEESQKDYITVVEEKVEKEYLNSIRNRITKHLTQNGFEGSYPDFKRYQKMKGLVSFSNDGFSANIAFNQSSYQFISVKEGFDGEELFITLLLDNALPAKKQFIPYNMFSAWFIDPKKNKWTDRQYVNYFTAISTPLFDTPFIEEGHQQVDLESFLDIALKKVTFQKLNQKDNETFHYNEVEKANALGRIVLWGKAALLFGFGMTLFFFLLSLGGLLLMEEGNWEAVISYIKEIPWHILIIVMSLAFFLPISIINFMANRKK